MEAVAFVALLVILVFFVLPIVALGRASATKRSLDQILKRLANLETRLNTLERAGAQEPTRSAEPDVIPTAEMMAARAPSLEQPPPLPRAVPQQPPRTTPTSPPPLPSQLVHTAERPAVSAPPINWEQFMGAKLFAWIGGIALFLGVGFFLKYSFEHNLIPPEVRVAIGFAVGLALVIGGIALKRKENAVTAQTLTATGMLILYTVTFACRSFYHFPFFQLLPTFVLMGLITAAAFLLAVRLDAIVVAILGMAGGFLTPFLLWTGRDNPLSFFGYIAALDIGLLLVARRKDWVPLPILGAIGTVVTEVAWVTQFFVSERYFAGTNVMVPMTVFLGFELLFLAGFRSVKPGSKSDDALTAGSTAMGCVALLWAFYFVSFHTIAAQPTLLLSYVFLADLGLLSMVFLRERLLGLSGLAGLGVFIFLAIWTRSYVTSQNLHVALGGYLVFALLHATAPVLLEKYRHTKTPPWCHAFPALGLVLITIPIFNLPELSLLVWPVVLLLDIVAMVLAVFTGTLMPVLIVLLLTLAALGQWMFRIPSALSGLATSLFLLGSFAVLFYAALMWTAQRFAAGRGNGGAIRASGADQSNIAAQLQATAAALPFLLLIMVTLRLALGDPSAVFALAVFLVVLLLGMAMLSSSELPAAIGLASALALEVTWHLQHFSVAQPTGPLLWYLVFTATFTVFPFIFHREFASNSTIWATSALAAPLHFFLVYDVLRKTHPGGMLGWLPALSAVPSLFGFYVLAKRTPDESPSKNAQLALFGGAALFFITLVFPIQFRREWITVGWALEGTALCWLFRRVPHPGLRLAGLLLLLVTFVRLAVNPAVLSYHAHEGPPVLNWYLYTYGTAVACLFTAGQLLSHPHKLVFGRDVRPLLYGLGTLLAFLLLNIEIADYFSSPAAAQLTFEFSGNFARDLSYSIGWAVFALVLLIVGIQKNIAQVRYASIALLGLTILKLFVHDLSELEQLYRIAAFLVVAVIAIVTSFLYQRFFGAALRQTP